MPRYWLILTVIILWGAGVAFGGATPDDLQYVYDAGYGARPAGMGRTAGALSGDLGAALVNPAGLVTLPVWTLDADFGYLSGGASRALAGVGGPWRQGHLGLAMSVSQLRGVTAYPRKRWVSDVMQYTGQAAYARRITPRLAGGGAVKFVLREGPGQNSQGINLDLGARYDLPKGMVAGASWNDLALQKIKRAASDESLPHVFRFGAAIEEVKIGTEFSVNSAVDLLFIQDAQAQLRFGTELVIPSDTEFDLKLRAGYNGHGLSVGGGIAGRYVRIDYAFSRQADRDFLDDYSHEISISVVPDQIYGLLTRGSQCAVEDYRRERYQYHLVRAEEALAESQLEVARDEYVQADAFATSRAQADSAKTATRMAQEAIDRQQAMADRTSLRMYDDSVTFFRELLADSVRALNAAFEQRLADERKMLLGQQRSDLVAQARIHLDNGEYYSALGKISLVLDNDPSDTAAAALREEVKSKLQRALLSDVRPTDPGALLRELDSMFVHMIGVDRLVSDSAVAEWYRQGIGYSRQEEYQQAIDIWQRVYRARPDHPTVLDDIRAAQRRLEAKEQE
ncbi:MAG: hypothetical protein ABIE70_06585 [bacterium]